VDFDSAAGDYSESARVSGGEEAETNLRASSSSTESPEQLGIATLGDSLELSVRSNNFEFHDIINLHSNSVHKRIVAASLHPAAEDADSLGILANFRWKPEDIRCVEHQPSSVHSYQLDQRTSRYTFHPRFLRMLVFLVLA